ncbi:MULTISPECIES: hypothetical protein [Paraburkholderia]|uniref:Uncharacterized protein n=1 Tax=Paraburkholderia madseniana TaxID=2599607 RepID=A0A6N6VZ88_9BURK|nr:MULTISPECIES: hypothetical protein [Paraburkholderia]KAE8753613.1 hypothetical protein FSO04_44160 [Paraburkholderia madseniana]MCX4174678.1 hypothetical protein [Paraburkholderia madseniana]MDQ6462679.1 hypothetical protein [Paraburkholderia madseniana]NPT66015.1 hypothetical protein [Paraburkholderia madseniana]
MLKSLRVTAVAVLVCATPSWVLSADFDGSKPLLCATIDAHFCDVGEVCYRTLPAILGAPQFMRINFAKKTIVGPNRSTEIRFMEPSNGQLLLQGTELGYAWSVALDTQTGAMSTTLVNHEDVFVLFAACTPT